MPEFSTTHCQNEFDVAVSHTTDCCLTDFTTKV